jgi:glycosyltransferase involved in cell wall biosynthesis
MQGGTKVKIRWRLFADEREPTTRERGIRVYEELQRQGLDADRWDGHSPADLIVLQYDMRDLDAAFAAAPIVVSDINDFVFVDTWMGPWKRIREGMARVQAITAGSPRLYDHLVRLHPRVRMIEQAVGPQYWTVKPKKHRGINVFWMGMTDNIIYFREIDGVLSDLAQEYDFTVHFCTSKFSHIDHGDGHERDNAARVAAKPYKTEFHEWSVDGALDVMARCDIGIAPLFVNEWAACKCANKAVNMMAAGLAVAVSDVPAYRAAIEDRRDGFLCDGPDDWGEKLGRLLGDKAARVQMARAGRERAREYDLPVIAGQWAQWLREVAG